MSLVKTKLLVVSEAGSEEAQQPIIIRGQPIEAVDAFQYLGAVMKGKGEVLLNVEDKIARASRAFDDGNLSRGTKRMVYRAAVLGVLLYGAETWKRMVYRLQCWGYSSMERRRGRGWCTGCSVGGTPLWSGDVEEDGVQAAVLGVLLYGAETWKRMVYRLQCWGYSSMERRRGRGWCTGCSVGGTPLWSGDVEEDGVQAAVLGVLLYGAETWKRMVYRLQCWGTPLWSGDVEEDGVQAAVLGVLLYGAETWKRMVYRLQCWGYSSMEWRRGRGWCTGCSVGGTPLWSGDVEEDGVQAAVLGVLLYGAETWKRMVYRAAVWGVLLYGAETWKRMVYRLQCWGYSSMEWRRGRGWYTGCSVGGTPLWSGDVEEDGVQAAVLGVLLYGAETWKRMVYRLQCWGTPLWSRDVEEDGEQAAVLGVLLYGAETWKRMVYRLQCGGTPLWSGDVEEDGVQAAVLGVLLYGAETWKRMVYRLQCGGYSSMERRRGRGWCTGCSVEGTPLWSGDVEEDGVQAAVLGVLLYGAETWKRMVYRLQC